MKYLTVNYWEKFWNNESQKFNGGQFEKLVKQLLKKEYPDECWEQTQPSWDGSRDFFYQFMKGNEQFFKWAECKMYQKDVSINILAPTLIMSTLKPVNEILFFSYSRLNPNARDMIADFAHTHKKIVRIYDDEKLEALILKHKEEISFSYFFPAYQDNKFTQIAEGLLLCSERVFVHRHSCTYSMNALARQYIRVNELIELWVKLENDSLNLQQVEIVIDLQKTGAEFFFESAGRQLQTGKSIFLQAGEVTVISFPLRVTGYAPKMDLPVVEVRIPNGPTRQLGGKFLGTWLMETPLIGYQDMLRKTEELYASHSYSIGILYGGSGVGKTRLMREIQSRYLLKDGKSIWISASQVNSRAAVWLRKLFSQLYSLPLICIEHLNLSMEINSSEQIAMNVLYNETFIIERNIDVILHALLAALNRHTCLLAIDNVQDFDEESQQIINRILNVVDKYKKIKILMSFNTDLLAVGRTSYSLFYRLRDLHRDNKIHYWLESANGFTPEQSIMYVKHCFGHVGQTDSLPAISYDYVIDQIARTAKNNPLFLEQILLKLCEDGVIKNDSDHFYLLDNQRMEQSLSQFPKDMEQYFAQRWQYVKSVAGERFSQAQITVQCLCFFGELPVELLYSGKLDEEILSLLIELGFVSREEQITFYHQLIGRFFLKKYPTPPLPVARICLKVLKDYRLETSYPAQYYICIFKCRPPSLKAVRGAMKSLLDGHIPEAMVGLFSQELFSAIEKKELFQSCSPDLLVHFYKTYCYQKQIEQTYSAAYKAYRSIYEKYMHQYIFFKAAGEEYFSFVKEFLNILLVLHRSEEVIQLANSLLQEFDSFSFQTEENRLHARSTLLNRLHVAYSRTEPLVESGGCSLLAMDCLKQALAIARSLSDPDKIIQNEIDYGNVYYLFGGPYEKAIKHWVAAKSEWQAHQNEVSGWEGGVYYHAALASSIGTCLGVDTLDAAIESIERVNSFHKRSLHVPFFFTKAMILKAIVSLMRARPFDEVLKQVNEAESLCQMSGTKGGFAVCSHIRAMSYDLLAGDSKNAAVYYHKALMQYANKCSSVYEEELNASTFKGIAVALRAASGQSSAEKFAWIKSPNLRLRMQGILSGQDDEWPKIQEACLYRGPLCNEKSGVNYPCP